MVGVISIWHDDISCRRFFPQVRLGIEWNNTEALLVGGRRGRRIWERERTGHLEGGGAAHLGM
jgi:hypothetical protein